MKPLMDKDINVGRTWVNNHGYLVYGSGRLVHRLVAEKAMGRKLKEGEEVHHVNGDKKDSRRDNLVVCTRSYHQLIHERLRVQQCSYNPNEYLWCGHHKCCHKKEEFVSDEKQPTGYYWVCKKGLEELK
jgi:hypothetical protein